MKNVTFFGLFTTVKLVVNCTVLIILFFIWCEQWHLSCGVFSALQRNTS